MALEVLVEKLIKLWSCFATPVSFFLGPGANRMSLNSLLFMQKPERNTFRNSLSLSLFLWAGLIIEIHIVYHAEASISSGDEG